jgi:hypothetical protein
MNFLNAFLCTPEVLVSTDLMTSRTLGMLKMQFGAFLVHPQEALRMSITLRGSPEEMHDPLLPALWVESSHSSNSSWDESVLSSEQAEDSSTATNEIFEAEDRTLMEEQL